jgi:hypothetical protein
MRWPPKCRSSSFCTIHIETSNSLTRAFSYLINDCGTLSLYQEVEAHRFVRFRGYHIFYTFGLHIAMRFSAFSAGRPLPPGRFLVLISVRGWVDPRAILRLEGLGQLKSPVISSRVESAAFRLVVPQPTTLWRAPSFSVLSWNYSVRTDGVRVIITLRKEALSSCAGYQNRPYGVIAERRKMVMNWYKIEREHFEIGDDALPEIVLGDRPE